MIVGSNLVAMAETSDMVPVLRKKFLDIQANYRVWIIILKLARDMIITYSQMNRTDKYSQHSAIIWPVLLNG